jgi:signal peptidase I
MRLPEGGFLALSSEILGRGHGLCCRTIGSSMFPLIRSRSLIQVEPMKPDRLCPGDVVLYQSGEGLVAHRLISKEQQQGRTWLITRGDSYPWSAKERLAPEQVLGRVTAVEWPVGLKLRIDCGPGRRLTTLLALISPFLWLGYLAMNKVRRWL